MEEFSGVDKNQERYPGCHDPAAKPASTTEQTPSAKQAPTTKQASAAKQAFSAKQASESKSASPAESDSVTSDNIYNEKINYSFDYSSVCMDSIYEAIGAGEQNSRHRI